MAAVPVRTRFCSFAPSVYETELVTVVDTGVPVETKSGESIDAHDFTLRTCFSYHP